MLNSLMRTGVTKRFLCAAVVLAALLLASAPAFSQSCALCYTQAASSGSRVIQALKSGILVLVVPPTFGSIGMIFVLYRKRNQVRRRDESGPDGNSSDGNNEDW